jgi:hypothetical protein
VARCDSGGQRMRVAHHSLPLRTIVRPASTPQAAEVARCAVTPRAGTRRSRPATTGSRSSNSGDRGTAALSVHRRWSVAVSPFVLIIEVTSAAAGAASTLARSVAFPSIAAVRRCALGCPHGNIGIHKCPDCKREIAAKKYRRKVERLHAKRLTSGGVPFKQPPTPCRHCYARLSACPTCKRERDRMHGEEYRERNPAKGLTTQGKPRHPHGSRAQTGGRSARRLLGESVP